MSTNNRIRIKVILAAVAMAILGLATTSAKAGTISYVKITGDADCGIDAENAYTHTLDFGTGTPGALINGVQFDAYNAAANGTLNFNREVATGLLSDHAGNAGHNVSGGLVDLLTDMYYNGNNEVDGTTTWTLSGLTAGYTYHTRIYTRQWGAGGTRHVTFVFDPDGAGPVSDSTDMINQDDATSVGFANGNDAYYINYEFTAVAGEDLVITLTQDIYNYSWHLYGLTNQEIATQSASSPSPADGATDVPRDSDLSWSPGISAATHDVYVGESFEEVDAATVPTASGLDTTSFDVGRLELGKTYFWRVDEVNGAPDYTVFKGVVWSFTVEPLAYAIENIMATSNGVSEAGAGPENTINGSGLNDSDQHSTASTDMWLASPDGAEPLSIQYEFDRVYKLHQMLVWNYNVQFELMLGFGIKDVTVEYSTDGLGWTVLADVILAPGTAAATYTANTAIDFGGVAAQYVRLTVNSGYGVLGQFGLSEVRFLHIPAFAREPQPASGATGQNPGLALSWRPGREAAVHEVYVGADEQAVIDGTAAMATVPEPSHEVVLDLNQTYYWKVVEVNEFEDPAAWDGDVWTFSVAESIIVDDFESYNDDDDPIYDTWLDGWVNDTGSTVGYLSSPFAETTLAHSGAQSMPLSYDNTGGVTISEAEYTLDASQDWTRHGIKSMSLFFFGDSDNAGGQLYAEINGTRVSYPGSAEDLMIAAWMPWVIDLASLNVQNVTTLTIGIEGAGAVGMLLVDDIRLYPYDGELIEAVDPGMEGLVAYWPLDGDASDAAGGHDGTISGTPDFVSGYDGQALDLASAATTPQYVNVAYSDDFALNSFTVAAWINVKDLDALRAIVGTRFNADYTFDFKVSSTYVHGDIGDGAAWLSTALDIDAAHGGVISIGDWHHIAYTIDAASGTAGICLDGVLGATVTFVGTPLLMSPTQELRIGNCSGTEYMNGLIDEVRIYNRALSPAEVAGLVGRPGPIYLPF
ncbi:MAG: discoidin domain-containing protein [Phycisphaerales bacterium]|nr:MAG: discoidin domain-containing protein [Phycisphaerales bacterium]